MENNVREKLIELITKDSYPLMNDYRKLSGLLFDFCPNHKKEVRALLTAWEEKIPEDLCKARKEPGKELILTRLTQRLVDASPMSTEASRWAVESWALALQIVSPADLGPGSASKPTELKPDAPIIEKIDLTPMQTPEGPAITVSRLGLGQYKSINEAIQAAMPNTRIIVMPGLYKETLQLNKPLEIVGDGKREEIVIEGDPCVNWSNGAKDPVRLKNLIIRGKFPVTQGQVELLSCNIEKGNG